MNKPLVEILADHPGSTLWVHAGEESWEIEPNPSLTAEEILELAAADYAESWEPGANDNTRGPVDIWLEIHQDGWPEEIVATTEVMVGPPFPTCPGNQFRADDDECISCGEEHLILTERLMDGALFEDPQMHNFCEECAEAYDKSLDISDDHDGHFWTAYPLGDEFGGVRARGGGTIHHDVCIRCEMRRDTNGWDTSWSGTGEPVKTVRWWEE